ncbi:MAG TPA: AAA family ATPase [Anaerolineae bacterium]|nr:AAA family ATPase [Anaerolineae bacterium]
MCPPDYPLPPEQARLRLYEAIGDFIAAIAAPRSAVLIFDDLHWADANSLDLLSYIARHQAAARLLIVGAYREGEAADFRAFQRTITELTRLRLLTTVTVSLGLKFWIISSWGEIVGFHLKSEGWGFEWRDAMLLNQSFKV